VGLAVGAGVAPLAVVAVAPTEGEPAGVEDFDEDPVVPGQPGRAATAKPMERAARVIERRAVKIFSSRGASARETFREDRTSEATLGRAA